MAKFKQIKKIEYQGKTFEFEISNQIMKKCEEFLKTQDEKKIDKYLSELFKKWLEKNPKLLKKKIYLKKFPKSDIEKFRKELFEEIDKKNTMLLASGKKGGKLEIESKRKMPDYARLYAEIEKSGLTLEELRERAIKNLIKTYREEKQIIEVVFLKFERADKETKKRETELIRIVIFLNPTLSHQEFNEITKEILKRSFEQIPYPLFLVRKEEFDFFLFPHKKETMEYFRRQGLHIHFRQGSEKPDLSKKLEWKGIALAKDLDRLKIKITEEGLKFGDLKAKKFGIGSAIVIVPDKETIEEYEKKGYPTKLLKQNFWLRVVEPEINRLWKIYGSVLDPAIEKKDLKSKLYIELEKQKYDPTRSSPPTYVKRVIGWVIRPDKKSDPKLLFVEVDEVESEFDLLEALHKEIDFEIILRRIKNPETRKIVRLKTKERLTFEEIAKELDKPEETIKSKYYRAIRKIKEKYKEKLKK